MKKKKLSVFLLVVVMMSTLAGCGKFTCDACGKEKSGKKYTQEIAGEKITLCKDCKEELDETVDALQKAFDGLTK